MRALLIIEPRNVPALRADREYVLTAGQLITGASVSLTVMVCTHGVEVLPELSVAVQVTTVVPFG